ncbi:MAG: Ig-like domain-containing protein [Cytophagales bacterium]|nr:Ig-like domain-containing protein [Cytophagales bacterium]
MKTIFFSLTALLFTFAISYAQPVLDFTEPEDDYLWVDPGRDKIELQFNQEVFKGSGNLTVFDAETDAIVDQISANSSDINILLDSPDAVSVTLSNSLGADRSFYILADPGFLKDAGDNDWSGISNKTVWNFSTRSYDPSGPMIISMNPDAGSAMVDYASPLQVTIYFDKFLSKGSGSISIKNLNLGSTASYDINHVDVSVLDQVIIISNVSVAADTEYSIKLDEGTVVDYFGNQNDGTSEPNRYTFKTIPASGHTPPAKLAIKYPRDDSQEVPVNFDQLRLSFDQDVNIGTGSIDLYEQSGDNLVSSFDVSFSYAWNGVAYVNFYTNNFELQPNTSYYILMNNGAFKTQSDNSNVAGISDKTEWNFTTGDIPRPNFTSFDPADEETGVSILLNSFELNIDTDGTSYFDWGGGDIRLYRSNDDQLIKTFAVSDYSEDLNAWTSDFFLHIDYYGPQLFDPSTSYYFLVDENVIVDQNGYGNIAITDKTIWNFTTQDPDTDPPVALSFNPDVNESSVFVGVGELEIDFDEPIRFGSSGSIRLYKAANDELIVERDQYHPNIEIDNDYGNPQLDAEFEDLLLEPSTAYYVLIDEGFLVDAFGNSYPGFSDKTAWVFTTEASDLTAPIITRFSPEDEEADVVIFNKLFGVLFDELTVPSINDPHLMLYAASDDQFVATLPLYTGYDQPSLDFFNGATSGYPFFFELNEVLQGTTDYYILMDAGQFEDRFGESFSGISDKTAWNFTTEEPETTPPLAIYFNPRLDETGVPVDVGELEINFNEEIKFGSSGSIRLYRASDDLLIVERRVDYPNLEIDNDDSRLEAKFGSLLLEPSTEYYVQIDHGFIVDLYGNPYAGISDKTTWTFTTEASDGSAPMISDIIPMDDQTDVSILASAFLLAFDEKTFVEVDNPSIRIYKSDGDELVKEVKLYGKPGPPVGIPEGPIFTPRYYSFNAGEILEPSTAYYILVDGSQFEDKFKNSFGGISDKAIWNFTTENSDETAPIPNSFYPDRNSPDVAVTVRELEIDFNEMIRFGEGGKVRLHRSDNNELVASWTKDNPNIEIDNNYRLDAEFFELLEPSTGYYVLIDEGFIVDIFGNAFGGFSDNSSWTFTTTASDHQAPLITSLEPTDNAADVPINQNYLVVTFDELVFPATYSPELRLFRSSDDLLVSKLRLNGDMAINIPDGEPMPEGSSYFFYLEEYLEPSTSYYITIDQDQFTDQFGIPFAGISEKDAWNFDTEAAETDPPTISHYTPSIGQSGVPLVFNALNIQFNEAIQLTDNGSLRLYKSSNDGLIVEITNSSNSYVDNENELQIWFSDLLLEPSTEYYVLIDDQFVADRFGNAYAGIQDKSMWTFTSQDVETEAPSLKYPIFSPFPGSTVGQLSNIYVGIFGFDEPVVWGQGNIYLLDRSTDEIVDQIDVSTLESTDIDNGIGHYFKVTLEPGKSYYIQLDPGTITDLFGNELVILPLSEQGDEWYFFTPVDDETGPRISYAYPEFNAKGVGLSPEFKISFDEAIFPGNGKLRIVNAGTLEVIEELSVFDDKVYVDEYEIQIYPQQYLQVNTDYYVEIDRGFTVDMFGNVFGGIASNVWNFETVEEDNNAPEVLEFIPEIGESNVSLITPIGMDFDEPVKIGSGSISIFDAGDDSLVGEFDVTANGIINFDNVIGTLLPTALEQGKTYYVLVDEGAVTDISGNSFAGISDKSTWTFTTESGVSDHEPPTISSVNPTMMQGEISVNTTDMDIEFSEYVVKGEGTISIYDIQDNLVANIDVAGDKVFAATSFVNVSIDGVIDFGTTYYVLISPGAFEDAYGNDFEGLSNKESWTFATESYSGSKSEVMFTSASAALDENNGTYRVELTLNEATFEQTIQIGYTASSSFSMPDDFTTDPSENQDGILYISIPAGTTNTGFDFDIVDDQIAENGQEITFSILSVGQALEIGSFDKMVITIDDNDFIRTLSFEQTSANIIENEGSYTVNINTDDAVSSDQQFTVLINPDSEFTSPDDYALSPPATGNELIITIPAGSSTASFDIEIEDDEIHENDESVEFTLINPDDLLTLGQNDSFTLTVVDNDDAMITALADELVRWQVYPNPASTVINLEDVDEVLIYNINGKFIERKDVLFNQISVNNLKDGQYILKLLRDKVEIGNHKILISKN